MNLESKPGNFISAYSPFQKVIFSCAFILFLIFGTANIPANAECLIGGYIVSPEHPIEISAPEIVTQIAEKSMPEGIYMASCEKKSLPSNISLDSNKAGEFGWPIWKNDKDNYSLVLRVTTSDFEGKATALDERYLF